jgi:hypothetical protein
MIIICPARIHRCNEGSPRLHNPSSSIDAAYEYLEDLKDIPISPFKLTVALAHSHLCNWSSTHMQTWESVVIGEATG